MSLNLKKKKNPDRVHWDLKVFQCRTSIKLRKKLYMAFAEHLIHFQYNSNGARRKTNQTYSKCFLL